MYCFNSTLDLEDGELEDGELEDEEQGAPSSAAAPQSHDTGI